jgi:hypothetical protein
MCWIIGRSHTFLAAPDFESRNVRAIGFDIQSIFNRQLDPFRSLARDGSLTDVNVSYYGAVLIAVNVRTGAVHFSVSKRVGRFVKERNNHLLSHLALLDQAAAGLDNISRLFLELG